MNKKKGSDESNDAIPSEEEIQENPELESSSNEEDASLEDKISFLEDQILRLQAEMINTQKSAQNDIVRARIFGLEAFMKDLLSVIDLSLIHI